MLIRSQDKRFLLVLENVKTFSEDLDHEIFAEYDCEPVPDERLYLGRYSSTAKAMKVLDMIQHQYASVTCVGSVAAVGQVFQMPQDDEVDA